MASDLGGSMAITLCTVILPMPNGIPGGVMTPVKAVQMTLGIGVDDAGKVIPAYSTGRRNLGQSCVRRLMTARGTLIDVVIPSTTANYGTDLTARVNDDMSTRELAIVSSDVDAELRKDERVIRTQTSSNLIGNQLIIGSDIFDAQGPFKLVIAVSQVTTTLLTVPQ